MERNIEPFLGKKTIELFLKTVAKLTKGKKTKLILAGGLAMIAYGRPERKTIDIDAEVLSEDPQLIDKINQRFQILKIPADISENISRWGTVDLPPAYRERTKLYKKIGSVEVHLLSPIDLLISKLRIFRDVDIDDALYLAKKFKISLSDIKREVNRAIAVSPHSTELLFFKKNLKYLGKLLRGK